MYGTLDLSVHLPLLSLRASEENSLFLIQNFFQFFCYPRFIVGEDCDLFDRNDIVHTEDVCLDCLHLLVDVTGRRYEVIPVCGFKTPL